MEPPGVARIISAAPRTVHSRRLIPVVLAALAGIAAVSCAVAASLGGGSQNAGERLFVTQCATCHGVQGDRVPNAPLVTKDFLDSRGDATLLTTITDGKSVMPAFGKRRGGPLTDDQIQRVLAYLNDKAGRVAPSLLASPGQAVYEKSCVQCHGENGERVPIAPLLTKGFLDNLSDSEIGSALMDGKGMMPAVGKGGGGGAGALNEDDIKAVIAFLRHRVDAYAADQASRGRTLYLQNCLSCHGEKGDRVKNIDLASPKYLQSLGDGRIVSTLNHGKGEMPAFGDSGTGIFRIEDTASMLAYLKAWAGLKANAALTGSAAVQGEGKDLYAANCASCHGASGDKIAGVSLMSSGFLDSQTGPVLFQTVARGNQKGMPAWARSAGGPLSDMQINGILEFLRASAKSGPPLESVALVPAPTSGGGAPPPAAADPAQVAKGKDIFAQSCVACHGPARDRIPTCKLADGAWLQSRGDAALAASIANGKGGMPSWGKAKGGTLSDDDITAILAYMKQEAGVAKASGGQSAAANASIAAQPPNVAAGQPPSAPAPAPSPAARAQAPAADPAAVAKGKDIFTQNCVACHRATRDGIPAAKLNDGAWLQAQGDDTLVNFITNGKGGMPAWGKAKGGILSDDDIKAVVSYLKDSAKR